MIDLSSSKRNHYDRRGRQQRHLLSRFSGLLYSVGFLILLCCFTIISFMRQSYRVGSIMSTALPRIPDTECSASLDRAVLFDTVDYKFLSLGGTRHWFHLLERILPHMAVAKRLLWNVDSSTNKNTTKMYLIFRDRYAIEKMDSFGLLLVVAVFSGGFYGEVIIGYLNSGISANDDSNEDLRKIHFQQLLAIRQERVFVLTAPSEKIGRCFQSLLRVDWKIVKKRYDWFERDLSLFLSFRQSIARVCNVSRLSSSENGEMDKLNAISSEDDLGGGKDINLHNKIVMWTNGVSLPALHRIGSERSRRGTSNVSERHVLLYQRDTSRRLVNAREVRERLVQYLLRSSSSGVTWTVDIFTHEASSRFMPSDPCAVVRAVSRADVMITPHGFQSVLLLLQPLASTLIEVHPALYCKPEVFGFVQAGLRARMDLSRSYLYGKSSDSGRLNLFSRTAQYISDYGWLRSETCLKYSHCRYFGRLQDVYMGEAFVRRSAMFMLQLFST